MRRRGERKMKERGGDGTETAFNGAEEETADHHARPGLDCRLESCDDAPEEDYYRGVRMWWEHFPANRQPLEQNVYPVNSTYPGRGGVHGI